MTEGSKLLEDMLAVAHAPKVAAPSSKAQPTRSLTVDGDKVEAELRTEQASQGVLEGKARDLLDEYGLDPAEFEVSGFRSSEWTMPGRDEPGVSVRFSFRRIGSEQKFDRPSQEELFAEIEPHLASPIPVRATGDYGFVVALGDMQLGKVDGDGDEGTLARVIDYLNLAADQLAWYRKRYDIGHIHIAWLGDHIEGFVSQGGANTWRTVLTLNEQLRLTRRIMFHALQTFAPLAENVTMVAIPGNHGEPQRFNGKGITRYDDSHDTEALVVVAEQAAMDPARYGHVKFYVPEPDEMTVTLDVAGTLIAHAHGHQFSPGKHLQWWQGQAFGDPLMAEANLLLLGHLHHEMIESSGDRLVLQVPALESESTWWRHRTGTSGNPGLVVAITKDGATSSVEFVRRPVGDG